MNQRDRQILANLRARNTSLDIALKIGFNVLELWTLDTNFSSLRVHGSLHDETDSEIRDAIDLAIAINGRRLKVQ